MLAALAELLRANPEPGEVWQHRTICVPSKVVSNKGMIKLVSIADGKTCVIPRREFIEAWELVSAAPEEES